MTWQRGTVVSSSRYGMGMVWSSEAAWLIVIPIYGRNGIRRHRSEVSIESADLREACGISVRLPAAQCHMMFRTALSHAGSIQAVGQAPPALVRRIEVAVAHELDTQQSERRLAMRSSLEREAMAL